MPKSLPIVISLVIAVTGCANQAAHGQDSADDALRLEVRRTPIVQVFEATHGAVVNISSTRTVRVRRSILDSFFYDFDEFFGRRSRRQLSSVGSGFVVHESGYIVTNAHVVDRTADTKVIFDDERSFDAQIVASDTQHDLALLKIDAPGALPEVRLGRSDDLMIGETVLAIGNPLGYQHTLTTGVVSATSRDLSLFNEKTGQELRYENLIQTDAGINPGSSGGPLLNVLGELIGITTAIRADAQNIGFAIPVETLKAMLPAMLQAEQAGRFFLGARINADRQVTSVASGSPAERAGMRPGDRITAVDDRSISSEKDYYLALIERAPGDRLNVDVERDQRVLRVRAMLQAPPRADGLQLARDRLGLSLEPLSPGAARHFGRRGGLIISEIEPGGPAAQARVQRGDVLTVLGRYYVTSLNEVGQVLDTTLPGQRLRIRILRLEQSIVYRDETRITLR